MNSRMLLKITTKLHFIVFYMLKFVWNTFSNDQHWNKTYIFREFYLSNLSNNTLGAEKTASTHWFYIINDFYNKEM